MRGCRVRLLLFFAIVAAVTVFTGCSIFSSGGIRPTKVISAPFGMTNRVILYKMGNQKPAGHVLWGNDISEGSSCRIVITSISLAKPVFTYMFSYSEATSGQGYNFPGGVIIEPDPFWHRKVGQYVVALYVNDRRISTDTFDIVP